MTGADARHSLNHKCSVETQWKAYKFFSRSAHPDWTPGFLVAGMLYTDWQIRQLIKANILDESFVEEK